MAEKAKRVKFTFLDTFYYGDDSVNAKEFDGALAPAEQMRALGCEQLAVMPDVIGEIIGMKQQPSGIRVGQMRVPIGVFGMIFESRPNVTIEAASLSIKSGNACILRGGSEAIDSNKALAKLVQQALVETGLAE